MRKYNMKYLAENFEVMKKAINTMQSIIEEIKSSAEEKGSLISAEINEIIERKSLEGMQL